MSGYEIVVVLKNGRELWEPCVEGSEAMPLRSLAGQGLGWID